MCIHNYYILHSATVPTCAVSNYYLLTMACEAVATHQPIEVEVRVGGVDPSHGNQTVRDGRIASALDAMVAIDVGDLEESSDLSDGNSLSREHPLILSEMEERLENHMLCTDRDTNDSVSTSNSHHLQSSSVESGHRNGFWNGVWACFGPIVSFVQKDKRPQTKEDSWDIPFADIRELEFIGSGSQGAVFVGEYRGEHVAVKKVKDVSYCHDIRQLRKLTHPNIVKFL